MRMTRRLLSPWLITVGPLSTTFASPLHSSFAAQGTLLAYHTTAFPHLHSPWLGNWQYVHQLNVAGTEAAARDGYQVIDLEAMLFGIGPAVYLRDSHHPTDQVCGGGGGLGD